MLHAVVGSVMRAGRPPRPRTRLLKPAAYGLLAAGLLLCGMRASSSDTTTVINFDSLSGGQFVAGQYASLGVHFSGAVVLQYPNYGYNFYPPRSYPCVIYNFNFLPFGNSTITATFDTPQRSVGAYVTCADT